jgi:SAM-dependent methyltransferase
MWWHATTLPRRRAAAAVAAAAAACVGGTVALSWPAARCQHRPSVPDAQIPQSDGSWRLNLGRTSGYWGDARWYDVQIDRKLGVVAQMIDELVFALPPLPAGSRVADLCSGSGRAALSLLRAYPEAHVSLVDMDNRRTAIAVDLARQMGLQEQVQVVEAVLDPDAAPGAIVPGGPERGYDLITATCAIRVMANPPAHYTPPPPAVSADSASAPAAEETKAEAVARTSVRAISTLPPLPLLPLLRVCRGPRGRIVA